MLFTIIRILLYLSQGLALFFGIKNRANTKNGTQQYFLYFMIYVVINEVAAYNLGYFSSIGNAFVYNIYTVVSFMFYFYWFNKVLKLKRNIILVAIILFFVSVVYSLTLDVFFLKIWFHPLLVGTLSILIFVTLLFTKMLKSKSSINYFKSQIFWFASGLLIFNIGYLPILFFQDYIKSHSINYSLVLTILNIIVYGCFSKGFTCQIKN